MDPVVLINPFVVPDGHRHDYLEKYRAVMVLMAKQPGFLGGALHRATDPGSSRFQFINVNRWESAEAFHAALAVVDPAAIFGDLTNKVEASPALFAVEISYPPAPL